MSRSRIARRVGDIVAVPLGDGKYAFGWILDEPLIAFFDLQRGDLQPPPNLTQHEALFRIWVMNHSIVRGAWPVVGHVEPSFAQRERPWFYKQDPISKIVSLTRDGNEELAVMDVSTLDSIECAAVWEPEHVVDRIKDRFAGVPNRWVGSMAIR